MQKPIEARFHNAPNHRALVVSQDRRRKAGSAGAGHDYIDL